MRMIYCTGWSISFLYTLTGWYGKNDICMVKIGVVTFSVHPEISFGNNKSEKIAEILFYNRYIRDNRNNRDKIQKMFKMDSFFVGHKHWLFFCYFRHISLQNEMKNIQKLEKTVKSAKKP